VGALRLGGLAILVACCFLVRRGVDDNLTTLKQILEAARR
jgi:hypothetical protein